MLFYILRYETLAFFFVKEQERSQLYKRNNIIEAATQVGH